MLVSFAVAGCGSIAGVASALVSGPVEHVRIRLQLQGPRAPPTIATVAVEAPAAAASAVSSGTRAFSTVAAAAAPVEYGGSVDAFRSIYTQHGLRGVFRGLPATGLREAVGCGMYFGVYEVAKRGFAESVGGVDNLGIHHFLMAGGLSGVLAWIPSYPIDIIKSKIQADVLTGQRRYPGVSIIRDLVLEAGPTLLPSPPLQRSAREHNGPSQIVAAAQSIFRAQGLRGFYRGFSPCLVRAAPVNAMTFLAYGKCPCALRPAGCATRRHRRPCAEMAMKFLKTFD